MINKEFFTNISAIKDAINKQKLVVFVGAGASIEAGVPSWNELIETIKKDIDIQKDETDSLRIAQMLYQSRHQKEYIDKIRAILKHKHIRANCITESIFKLNPNHILTTNFDDLLEQVIQNNALPFTVVKEDLDFPYASNANMLVKIHGDLNKANFVLKEDDYLDYSKNHPLMESFLKSVFATKVVLFVGYSFSDYDLKLIVQNVRNILGHNFQYAYLLDISDKIHPSMKEYYRNKGIHVINYHEADSDNHNYIKDYLFGKNPLRIHYILKESTFKNNQSKKLFYFLEFINQYDSFINNQKDKYPIEQLYHSLMRFSDWDILPIRFIQNIWPIRIGEERIHFSGELSVETNNRELSDFILKNLQNENSSIILADDFACTLSSSEKENLEYKIRKTASILNKSSVFYIYERGHKPDSFGNYSTGKAFSFDISDKYDNNIIEMIEMLDFKSMINRIKSYVITENSEIDEDIQIAYLHYKLCDYYTAYRYYEQIATKAWQLGRYHYYYIANINIKFMRYMIEDDLYDSFFLKNELCHKIDSIELDKLLYQIPNQSNDERELYRMLIQDDVLNNTSKKVDEILESISSIHELYTKKGGFYESNNKILQLSQQLFYLYAYYTRNWIIYDCFSVYKKIFNKAFIGYITSYTTSNKYSCKLKEFHSLFIHFFVQYGETEHFNNELRKRNLTSIRATENAKKEIVEIAQTYFNSAIHRSTFGISDEREMTKALKSFDFRQNYYSYLCRILYLLGIIEFDKNENSSLSQIILDFLKVEKSSYHYELSYLNSIITNQTIFSFKDLLTLTEYISQNTKKYNSTNILESIAEILKEVPSSERLNNEKTIELILTDEDSLFHYVSLWKMSSDSLREFLKQKIINILSNKFDAKLYKESCLANIFDYQEFLDDFRKELQNDKINTLTNEFNDNIETTRYDFLNNAMFIHGAQIPYNELCNLNNFHPYQQFYIAPEIFNYKSFNPYWLLLGYSYSFFLEKLRNIPELKKALEGFLTEHKNQEIAKIYLSIYFNN